MAGTTETSATDAFHAHLSHCHICRFPDRLCFEGARLLGRALVAAPVAEGTKKTGEK